MRILYGVQATGNGHITRARAIAPKLQAAGAEVTWLFSGRPWAQLFEMDVFGDFQWRKGLTFSTRAGHIQYLQTAIHTHFPSFVRDVMKLDLRGYDLIVSDFEPVTAWAAFLRGRHCAGIGHQYAFGYDIPKAGVDFFGKTLLRYFAPVTVGLGVHWHHFHHPIIPPIIESTDAAQSLVANKIIVYLPFEEVDAVVRVLREFRDFQFHVYSPSQPGPKAARADNVHVRGLSRAGFRADFTDASGVICNAGFELASEAFQAGKKLLVKPLHGQMEQMSNALAVERLQLGQVMQELERDAIATWLDVGRAVRVRYPDVAQHVVDWLLGGARRLEMPWIESIWAETVTLPA